MKKTNSYSILLAFITLLLLNLFVVEVTAEEKIIAKPIGAQTFEIPAPKKDENTWNIGIPIQLEQGEKLDNLVIEDPIQIIVGGKLTKAYQDAFTFSLDSIKPKLLVEVVLTKILEAGTYEVKVILSHKNDNAKQVLSFSFVREGGQLLPNSQLRIENVVYLPWDVGGPLNLFLINNSKVDINGIKAVPGATLKGPDNTSLSESLNIIPPKDLANNSMKPATINPTGRLPLGLSNGSIIVTSPQLTTPVSIPLEIYTRLSRLWLVFTLLIGIFGGFFVRNCIENKRLKTQAMIIANQQLGRIEQLETKIVDQVWKAKIIAIIDKFKQEIDKKDISPEDIKTLTQNIGKEVDSELELMDRERTTLQQSITELRTKLSFVEWLPFSIRQVLLKHLQILQAQERSLAEGNISTVKNEFSENQKTVIADFSRVTTNWIVDLKTLLAGIKNWRTVSDAAQLEKREAETETLYNLLIDDKFQNLDDILRKLQILVERMQDEILRTNFANVILLGNDIYKYLKDLKNNSLSSKLVTLFDAIGRLSNIRSSTSALDDLPLLVEVLNLLQKAIADAILATAPEPADQSLKSLLDAFEFEKAVVKAIELRNAKAREETFGAPAPGVLIETFMMQPRSVAENILPLTSTTDNLAAFNAVNAANMANLERSLVGYAAIPELEQRLLRFEIIQSLVLGFLIAFTGYIIFKDSFLGKSENFLLALLWGFGSDISLAKVREISSPVLTRPLPTGKPG